MNAAPNLNYFWADLLMEELYRCGVRTIAVAPGSRSSPLAEAAAGHGRLQVVVHPDERGLGFFALGHAMGSGRPTAIVTTSGTASANLFPAIAEAHHAAIPLIALTADRPPELRACGANQATDQVKLFGSFVRFFADVPPPSEHLSPAYLLGLVDDALHAANGPVRGPVHLNLQYREPLAPVSRAFPRTRLQRELRGWMKSSAPWVTYADAPLADVALPRDVRAALERASRGLILAGALPAHAATPILSFAKQLGWPVLPDLQSGLRLGAADSAAIAHADLLMGSRRFARGAGFDAILQFGSGFVTRRLLDLAAEPSAPLRIVVDAHAGRVDPQHRSAHRIVADPGQVAEALRRALPARSSGAWGGAWLDASQRVERELERRLARANTLTEPGVAWQLSRLLREQDAWFLGNSLPIRMAASFASARSRCVVVAANRGLSGIDGELATAVGYASGANRPVTLLLGDLTLLHDLNSLLLLRDARVPVTAVVVNNDGGGIFSLLPVAEHARHFEQMFGTPHGVGFQHAAAMFGLPYAAPASPRALARAWRTAAGSGASSLIEIRTRRAATAAFVRRTQASVWRAVDAMRA
jgi:2-succinyl-5-enolpyruvyl-6-hydroxy-3-cyclohexene-1-carboxylate synthase